MNQEVFNKEMRVAEGHAKVSEKRGVNWAVISLGLIALTIFATAILFTLMPDSFFNLFEKNAESPGTPVEQRETR